MASLTGQVPRDASVSSIASGASSSFGGVANSNIVLLMPVNGQAYGIAPRHPETFYKFTAPFLASGSPVECSFYPATAKINIGTKIWIFVENSSSSTHPLQIQFIADADNTSVSASAYPWVYPRCGTATGNPATQYVDPTERLALFFIWDGSKWVNTLSGSPCIV